MFVHIYVPIIGYVAALIAATGHPATEQPFAIVTTEIECVDIVPAGPLIWRKAHLAGARKALRQGDTSLVPAYENLIKDAEGALKRGPYSVTNKANPPPSGNKGDYWSIGPYWWPNPSSGDGLPYVQRDGERNPESRTGLFDKQRTQDFRDDVVTLALAAYFSGDERFALHAQSLLNTWFISESTRMSPHLNYGQSIPGITPGRRFGVIDTLGFTEIVDAVRLLRQEGMLNETLYAGIRAWFSDYAGWLATSPIGLGAREAANNHGTHYDTQLLSYSLFAGDCAVSEQIVSDTKRRIGVQILADGRMPLEEKRTRSFHYYIYNLDGFFKTARMAEALGENLYEYKSPEGGNLVAGLGFLVKYAGREDDWPFQQIGTPADTYLWQMLRTVSLAIDHPVLDAALQRASGKNTEDRINLLTYTYSGKSNNEAQSN